MHTTRLRLHGHRHPTSILSNAFTRLNYRSNFRSRSTQVWASKRPFEGKCRELALSLAAGPPKPLTGTTHVRLSESQNQNNGTQSPLEISIDEKQELRILERAQAFGIMTTTDLLREADFNERSLDSTLLINRQPFSTSIELWCILLDFQRLRFGQQGVKKTWHFMKDRAGGFDESFFCGPASDHLWSILISEGVKWHSFLQQICEHEMKSGAKRPSFYVDIVGSLLANNLYSAAYRFSLLLRPCHPATDADAYQLFIQACDSQDESALWNFRHVVQTFEKVQLYSRVIPYLCNRERFWDAWIMHKFLLSRGDLPPDFDSIKPLVKYFVSGDGFEEFLQDLKSHNISYDAQARQLHEHEKSLQYGVASGTLNIVSSRTLGIQPSRLSDNFVARAFATRAFSLDFILQGLRLLGLREIGPLGLRQIALSAGNPDELCRRLKMLKESGIDCGSSMYARVVTSLASQGRATLLSSVLASDQHPDVFDDLDLQEKLLAQYYRDSDWRQVARTLAILRVGNQQIGYDKRLSADSLSLNVLLRSVTRVGDWSAVLSTMSQMKDRSCPLTTHTLRCMHNTILSRRDPGKRPENHRGFDDVGFLLSLFQSAENAGTRIPPTFWREPIRRLGMLRRWNDLERILFWLAARYTRKTASLNNPSSTYKVVIVNHEDSIGEIFSPPLQRALIAWAFLYPKPRRTIFKAPFRLDMKEQRSGGNQVPFTRGVRVLHMLQDQYGVPVDVTTVRTVCFQQLRKRFAPDFFSGQLVRYNIYPKYDASQIRKSLNLLNKAWSGTLFLGRLTALQRQILRPRRVMRQPRSGLRRVKGRREVLNRTEHSQHESRKDHDIAKRQSELGPSRAQANVDPDHMDDVVMYRDIYNVSLEDYEKPDSASVNNRSSSI